MKIEDNPAFAEKLPRICSILGGEKTPLKIGECFRIQGYVPEFWIDEDGHFAFDGVGFLQFALAAFSEAINHPEKIIRAPLFSEDENAFLRLLVKNGIPWLARDDDGDFWGFESKPHNDNGDYAAPGNSNELPKNLLTQITFESGPFDAAAYLESEAEK